MEFDGADVITTGVGEVESVAVTSNALYAVEADRPVTVRVVWLPKTVPVLFCNVAEVNDPPEVSCLVAEYVTGVINPAGVVNVKVAFNPVTGAATGAFCGNAKLPCP